MTPGRALAGSVASLIATPPDVLELLRRSSADLSAVNRLVIGWPEAHLALGLSETLDTILAECTDAARVVLTADETPLTDFLARHAHRAPLVIASRRPEAASVSVRYAVTDLACSGHARDATKGALHVPLAYTDRPASRDNRHAHGMLRT